MIFNHLQQIYNTKKTEFCVSDVIKIGGITQIYIQNNMFTFVHANNSKLKVERKSLFVNAPADKEFSTSHVETVPFLFNTESTPNISSAHILYIQCEKNMEYTPTMLLQIQEIFDGLKQEHHILKYTISVTENQITCFIFMNI